APVVLVLHALGIDGETMETVTAFSKLADTEGFIAVYPDAELGTFLGGGNFPNPTPLWNVGGLFSSTADDVTFLGKVLEDLPKQAKVDPKRTYVVGMSNGGMMTYKIAAELSGRFAAMAAVAGTHLAPEWKPVTSAMPVLHMHGTSDQIVAYDGGDF